MRSLIARIIGDVNLRELKKLNPLVEKIKSLKEQMEALPDDALRAKTEEFRARLSSVLEEQRRLVDELRLELDNVTETGFHHTIKEQLEDARKKLFKAEQAALEELLPEAYAVVAEAAWRTVKMRHFDVQLLGGIVLHQGRIAEMKTGEGKTLAATLPAYLNALPGKGVHIVTVNDYLAKRDSEWMGEIYKFLGLSVGLVVHGIEPSQRRDAYNSDITYGTNNEFGFDYLRDNMVLYKENMVQRNLNFAIVDEVDSILVDEARTPLIISGQSDDDEIDYKGYYDYARRLKKGLDYEVDEKAQTVEETPDGMKKIEKIVGRNIYGEESEIFSEDEHHSDVDNKTKGSVKSGSELSNDQIQGLIRKAIRAKELMQRDKEYVVSDKGEIIIVDDFTGRLMYGRRYSEGLHQMIEAKENVKIAKESKTLATITFQNYFRMYRKLAGMTGTAKTEEEEFQKIYGMDVLEIPTNKPMIRHDLADVIYKNERAKFRAVVEDIVQRHSLGQPLLVGTISIEKSEELSRLLQKRGVRHEVLNAKHHAREADIIKLAGQGEAVTIATNMAGRGTDIVLGDGVTELGGLHIIGTERHEARRIDNQLRGRSGRQGDPGSSQFFISMEDDLMRLFGSDNILGIMEKLGLEEDVPIDHPLISRAIENAQKRVESRNFDIRKHILEYDNVINEQREVIYSQRRRVLEGEDLRGQAMDMTSELIDEAIAVYANEKVYDDEWDLNELLKYAEGVFLPPRHFKVQDLKGKDRQELHEMLYEAAKSFYAQREAKLGSETMRELERVVLLRTVDTKWMDHIDAMDDLRQGIGLRAFAQRDPLVEYKYEAYEMFQSMIRSIREEVVGLLYRVQVASPPKRQSVAVVNETPPSDGTAVHGPARAAAKPGRNDPCPCGSGKKYKKCCGK
ncbi:MAG: preprotein translocase subunit SecA [Dethiobacter sp.]|nr:preprotein translocase subunit SecA [Dethiobacter sp.]